MMLEAQFGSDIAPIERPRLPRDLPTAETMKNGVSTPSAIKAEPGTGTPASNVEEEEEEEEDSEEIAEAEDAELARLHALGIPFPGIEIKVDKHVARVWLENLEVECSYAVLRDRVRVVIERAVETIAPMWAEGPPSAPTTNGSGKGSIEVSAKA
jgi:cleavage and polyadenylation specificity factor subunit 3